MQPWRKTSVQIVDVTGGQQLHVKKLTFTADPKIVLAELRALIERKGWDRPAKRSKP